jgi:hypothetical protein
LEDEDVVEPPIFYDDEAVFNPPDLARIASEQLQSAQSQLVEGLKALKSIAPFILLSISKFPRRLASPLI